VLLTAVKAQRNGIGRDKANFMGKIESFEDLTTFGVFVGRIFAKVFGFPQPLFLKRFGSDGLGVGPDEYCIGSHRRRP
jgi:hypothetical protein